MKDRTRKAKRIVGLLALLTLAAALVWAGVGAVQILRAGPATSFPWYTSFAVAALYFGPVLAMELALYLALWLKGRGGRE